MCNSYCLRRWLMIGCFLHARLHAFARGQPLLQTQKLAKNRRATCAAKAKRSSLVVKASLLSCHGGSFLSADEKAELEEVAELIGQAGKV